MRGILLAALFTPGTCFAGLNFVSSSTVYVDSDATAFASRVWIGKDDRIWLSGRLQGRTVLAEFDPYLAMISTRAVPMEDKYPSWSAPIEADAKALWGVGTNRSPKGNEYFFIHLSPDGILVSSRTMALSAGETVWNLADDMGRLRAVHAKQRGDSERFDLELWDLDSTGAPRGSASIDETVTATTAGRGRVYVAGATRPEQGAKWWVGEIYAGKMASKKVLEVPSYLGPAALSIARIRLGPGNRLWAVGISSNQLTAVALDKNLQVEGIYKGPGDSRGCDIDFDPQGNAWVTGVVDNFGWIGKVSPNGRLLATARLINGPPSDVGVAADARGNVYVASAQYVWGMVGRGIWIGRFTDSAAAPFAAVPDLSFRDPARDSAKVSGAQTQVAQILEQAGSASPAEAVPLYTRAWELARDVKDHRLQADIDARLTLARLATKDLPGALAAVKRGEAEANGVDDRQVHLALMRAGFQYAKASGDRSAIIRYGSLAMSGYAKPNDPVEQAEYRADVLLIRLQPETGGMVSHQELIQEGLEIERAFLAAHKRPHASFYVEVGERAFLGHMMRVAAYMSEQAKVAARFESNEELLLRALALSAKADTGLGRFDDAAAKIREAVKLAENRRDDHLRQPCLEALGYLNFRLGYDSAAEAYFGKAIEIGRRLNTDSAFSHMKLGEARLAHGDISGAYNEATVANSLSYQHMYGDFVAQSDPSGAHFVPADPITVGISRLHCSVQGIPEGLDGCYNAFTNYKQAAQSFSRTISDGNALGDDNYALAGEVGMGLAQEGQGEFEAAAAVFKGAVDQLEISRWQTPRNQRLNLYGAVLHQNLRWIDPYQGLARVAKRTGAGPEASFYYAEASKARAYVDAVFGQGRHAKIAPPGLREERQVEVELAAALRARDLAAVSTKGERDAAAEKVASLWARRSELIAAMRHAAPLKTALLFPEPLPVDSIKLRPREVLVEYVVTRTVAIAFILKDGKLAAALDIPIGRGSLQAIVRTYLRSFQDIHAAKDLARYDPAAGLQVYRRIFEPVLQAKDAGGRPLIAKSDKLIIVPDDILGVLPFEALPTTAPARLEMPSGLYGPVPVGVSYVGDEYDIAYQRSATALTLQRMMRRGGNAASGLFVLADPIFSEADPRSKGLSEPMSEAKADVIETMGVGGLREQFSEKRLAGGPPLIPRLDRTGLMAEHLRDKVFAGEDVTLLEGASATKANLTPMAIEDKRYVVFATHGLVDGDLPGLTDPALLLTQYGGRSPSDGLLTMGEISKMRLNADLVALTACKTGLGRTVWGEGALSLGRAFQSAGARSVLISMWEVSEDSTNEFVERLFQHLKNGETSRKALRSARSEIRKLGYDHPYYWAPFVLTTD